MGDAATRKILSILNDGKSMKEIDDDFRAAVRQKTFVVEELIDLVRAGESLEFHALLQREIDHPAFDEALDIVLAKRPAVAEALRHEISKAACVVPSGDRSSGTRGVVDMFVVVVTGTEEALDRLVTDRTSMAAIERVFHESGLTLDRSRVALSDVLVDPAVAANARPGTLREMARGFETFAGSDWLSGDKSRLEAMVEDMMCVSEPEGYRRPVVDGPVSRLLFGGYAREYAIDGEIEVDGMTAQIITDDEHGEFSVETSHFLEAANDAAGGDVAVSLPHWVGRGCACAAVFTVKTGLDAEATTLGLDVSEGFQEASIGQSDGYFFASARHDGHLLGPMRVPSALTGLEADWATDQLAELAAYIAPPGLFHPVASLRLN